MSAEPPRLAYWHLWADDEGVSRHTRCELASFDLAALGPGNSPQWNETLLEDGKTDEARARLLLVIGCPVPPDETEEHAAWVETARTLLPEVTPP